MCMFSSHAPAYKNVIKQGLGTSSGCTMTFPAVANKSIWLDKVTGFTDKSTGSLVNATNILTGTVSTASGDATVTGTNTLFLTELEVGNIVIITDTAEILQVLSVTDDLHFEATANSGNDESSSAIQFRAGQTSCAQNKDIDWKANGTVVGKSGKAMIVTLVSSTSNCNMQGGVFTL